MTRKTQILFVLFFVLIIFGIPVTQGIIELRRGDGIQPLHFLEDTFITPVRRANELSDMLDRLHASMDSLGSVIERAKGKAGLPDTADSEVFEPGEENVWEYLHADELAEEILFSGQDIQKRALTINRHITAKESLPRFAPYAQMVRNLNSVYELMDDEADVQTVVNAYDNAAEQVEELRQKNPSRSALVHGPMLAADAFVTSTFFSEHYIREYETEMEESSIFADGLRPWMQFTRFMLLHDGGSKAILGRGGWFFYKPGFDYLVRPWVRDKRTRAVDYNDVALTEDPVDVIVHFQNELAEHGVELLVTIVPGKASIYPEMIDKKFDGHKLYSHSLTAIEELREAGVEVVDLFHPFMEEKKRDPEAGDSLYLQKDTHWKARALRLAARRVAERVKQYPWYEQGSVEYVMDSMVVDRVGDVGTMTTLPEFKVRELRMDFDPEPTKCYKVFQVRRDEDGNELSRRPYRDDYSSRSKIMLLGDSFSRIYQTDAPRSAGWISHIAMELGQPLSTIVNDGGASTLVRETLARKKHLLRGKKLVIWEFVERDFRFGAEGWKKIEL